MKALSEAVEDYLAVRRSLGFKLTAHGRLLADFVEYLEATGTTTVTTAAAVAWAIQPQDASPRWWAHRLGVVRGFAAHLHAFDPAAEVPPKELLACPSHRTEPHLYSDAEVAALMAEARALHPALRGATYETLIGLIAVCGLRPGEALRLDRGDVDWAEGVVRIVGTKFGKSRDVPVQPATLEALGDYGRLRDQRWPEPRSASFFVSTAGTRPAHRTLDWTFRNLLRPAGITWPSHRRSPRLHDLRHSFAVKTVVGWYRADLDVEARLPLLSTYLGHSNPSHTYWYLSACPELLSLAAGRREQAKEGCS
ncbi:MAG: tyrosine-type recombinase/integrase [Actinomycetota bacterium]|nr:tyrosine-type recombinase/integrase [Actinomycetota bacterium]